jgi:hypothetical protein
MSYTGACHCGEVTFSVDADLPKQAMSCNCSFCRRKGSLLTFVPATQFELTSGEEGLKSYFFNKHRIEHRFCANCGTQPFSAATAPDGTDMRAINLRCVPEANLEALEIKTFDGASV